MAHNQSGPVNTIHTYLGEGKPLALLSVPVRHLRSLTGTACDRLSVAASSGRPAFSQRGEKRHSRRPSPPGPHTFPVRFYQASVRARGKPPKNRRRMDRLFVLSDEIVYEICVSVSWHIFSLKRFAFQTIRPNVVTDKTRFIRSLAAGRCQPPSHFAFFQKQNALWCERGELNPHG